MAATLILMAAVAFLAVMVLGAYIVEQYKIRTKKLDNTNFLSADSTNNELRALYIAENSKTNHIKFQSRQKYAWLKLMELLKLRFGENLTTHSEVCTLWSNSDYLDDEDAPGENQACSTILGIKTPKGTAFVSLSHHSEEMRWSKPHEKAPRYELQNGDDLSEYEENNNTFIKASSVEIIGPSNDLVQEIYELMKPAIVTFIDRPQEEKRGTIVEHYMLQKNRGEVSLRPINRSVMPIPDKLLDMSYNDVPIEYEGESFNVSMSKAIGIITDVFIRNGENISIFGKMGCGKTHLADEIGRRLGSRFGTVVIYLTPQMVTELQSSEFMSQLAEQVSNLSSEYGTSLRPVFIVDEAEQLLKKTDDGVHSTIASYMLSTMDGLMQRVLNCSFILTFNCPKDQLNPAAFREGRMGAEINVTEISAEKANATIEELRVRNTHLHFDEKKWKNLQAGSAFALSSIYSCFAPKSKRRMVKQALIELGYIKDDEPAPGPAEPRTTPATPAPPPMKPGPVNPKPHPSPQNSNGWKKGKKNHR